ncbi:UNKNOWN [Stylonychia lemnae]|uniref:Uncharacterized protein n=1 Tax=Stylonychia lemnae TaxID=5949 RepID=A0A077ZZT9_STYLE|nr:UNKNOWN [Stylonychia lemnae]|eukprot:CDW75410.1 UNKNOWN [Stylonychia lemnae]
MEYRYLNNLDFSQELKVEGFSLFSAICQIQKKQKINTFAIGDFRSLVKVDDGKELTLIIDIHKKYVIQQFSNQYKLYMYPIKQYNDKSYPLVFGKD